MAIFNSYVSLPEGMPKLTGLFTVSTCISPGYFWCENQGTRVAGPRSSYPAAGTSDDTGPLPLGGSHGVGSIVESHGCVWKWESSNFAVL